MARQKRLMPVKRDAELVVEELADETLVYDMKRHRAYCLNPTVAVVWRHCDGQTTVAETAEHLSKALALPANEGIVWIALDRLTKARLLRERPAPPEDLGGYSRREWARKLGLMGALAVLWPAVSSITAPTPAEAAVTTCTILQCRSGTPANNCNGCLGARCAGTARFCRIRDLGAGPRCGCFT
jgi:hypothetical protein